VDAYDYIKPYLPAMCDPKGEEREWVACRCPFHKGSHHNFYIKRNAGFAWCHKEHRGWSLDQLLKDLGVRKKLASEIVESIGEVAKRPKRLKTQDPTIIPERIMGLFQSRSPVEFLPQFQEQLLDKEGIRYYSQDSRIIFPIRDLDGKLIALSGRATDNSTQRYRFYGESRDKSKDPVRQFMSEYLLLPNSTLWGCHTAFPAAEEWGFIIVVEGFKARLHMLQSGYPNTVAALGSYLSKAQQTLLSRLGLPTFLFFDNDKAGISGMEIGGEALTDQVYVKVCHYDRWGEEDEQPDDLSDEETVGAVEEATSYHLWRRNMSSRGLRRRRIDGRKREKERNERRDWKAQEKMQRRANQEIRIIKDKAMTVRPIAGSFVDPRSPDGPRLESFAVRVHEDRGFWDKDASQRKGLAPTTVCSAGWDEDYPEPCNSCRANEDGNTTVGKARDMEAIQVAVLEAFHVETRKTKKGDKEYEVITLCRKKRCPECAKKIPKVFGRSGFFLLGPNHFDQFLASHGDAEMICKSCGGDVDLAELFCPECEEPINPLDDPEITDDEIEELCETETECPHCKKVVLPEEELTCTRCSEPVRASIFDCSFKIKKIGKGTGSSIHIEDLRVEELSEDLAHLGEPLDFEHIFEAETLEEQAKVMNVINFFEKN